MTEESDAAEANLLTRIGSLADRLPAFPTQNLHLGRKVLLAGGSATALALGVGVPAIAYEARDNGVPQADVSASKHCVAQATERPAMMSFALEKGKKRTYVSSLKVKALDTACRGLGQRVVTYRFQSKPADPEANYISTDIKRFTTDRAISKAVEMQFGPNWCKHNDADQSPKLRLSVRTD